jgi:hypothetical protein
MPWPTWQCSICKVGRSGRLSGVVVVRTVVSARTCRCPVTAMEWCDVGRAV